MMNIVLYAQVPTTNPAPSPWKAGPGCSWRLCANRSRPHVIALSLHFVRHQTDSSGFMIVNVEYPDIATRPVQNLHVARQLPKHPRDFQLHLSSGEPSTEIHLPLTYSPPGEKVIALKISVMMEEQPTSPTAVRDIFFPNLTTYGSQRPRSSPSGLQNSVSHARSQSRERHIRTPSPEASSITWIDERKYYSSASKTSRGRFNFGKRSADKELSECVKGEQWISRNIATDEVDTRPLHELRSLLLGSGLEARAKQSQGLHTFSDVTLIVKRDEGDDVEFYLHRCVLAMASPVFRAMFTCSMRESLTGRVELSSFDVATVSIAVRHMYGENIADSVDQNPFGIYRFGHLFDVSSLLGVTQKFLISKMSTSTCIDVLNLGAFFNDNKLEDHATTYVLEHFSEISSVRETRQKLCSLPPKQFLALLESDMLVATELEIFLVSMNWLSYHEGSVSVKDVLRRIRWPLMTQHMFRTAMNSPMITRFPALRNFLRSSRTTISQHLNGTTPGRRVIFGHPMATVLVPAVRQPPAALLYLPEANSSGTPKSGSNFTRRNTQEQRLSSRNEKVFEYEGLSWGFRAELSTCKSLGCSHNRLSASLWLEQNDAGSVSSTPQREEHGSHLFPMKVKARCMVWNNVGGQLHHKVINFTFQSSGWASGWCVEDMLGGHDQTEVFFDKLSSIREVGPVLQVAIEILKCEKG